MNGWTTRALLGPNRWSERNVLELHAAASDAETAIRPGLSDQLANLFAAFLDSGRYTTTHPDSVSTARRLLPVIRTANTRGRLWGAIAAWLSAMAGVPSRDLVVHASVSEIPDKMRVVAALEMEEELLSLRAFQIAHECIAAHETGGSFSLPTKFREIFDYADDVRLGPSSRAILDAATARGIPYYRLTSGSLVQLGEGRFQRRIWTAETDATSAIAESIASDKDLTKRLLRHVGVPIPIGRKVTSPEDAWTAALEVGLPVVVKPRNANHQRGISIELTEREEVIKAYHWAIEDGQTEDVMVEQFARGQHHRLLVVGNKMVAASRGHMETVCGDGTRTVEQLVFDLNQDPRRGEAYTDPLGIVKLDAAAHIELAKQGLTIDSVPPDGKVVLIRRTGDLTTDCTEEVHPETARQAVLAARVVGLDIAGLDVLAEDIRAPLAPQRGAVVEVNAGPSLSSHVTPLFGQPRPVGNAVMEMLFPLGTPSTVPICAVVSTSHEAAMDILHRWIEEEFPEGHAVGYVDRHGIWVGKEHIPLESHSTSERVQALLGHPWMEAVFVPIVPDELGSQASPVPRIDRLVVAFTDAGSPDGFVVDSAWKTLGHAMHTRTRIEWLDCPDPWQSKIRQAWSSLTHHPWD